jgi:transposase
LKYLPPYSPDYNPIEQSFHKLKGWLKRNRELCPIFGDDAWDERFAEFLKAACAWFTVSVEHRGLWHHASLNVYDVD